MRRLPVLLTALLLSAVQPLLETPVLSAEPTLLVQTSAKVDDYLKQVKKLSKEKGQEAEVIRLTNLVIATEEHAAAYFYRGIARNSLGDKQEAINDYTKSIAINPQNANTYYNRGNAKSSSGDNQGAIDDFTKAIDINPQDANAYYTRGNAKTSLGDNQGAIVDYNAAIALDPQFANAYYNRSSAKNSLGDKNGAIADLTKAISANPQDADAYKIRAKIRGSLGDRQGAITDLTKVIAFNPHDAIAYNTRGLMKGVLGDKHGAIADFAKAIAINPSNPSYRNNLAIAKQLGIPIGAEHKLTALPFAKSPISFQGYLNKVKWKDGSKAYFQGFYDCSAKGEYYGCMGFVSVSNPLGNKICRARVGWYSSSGASFTVSECRYR